METGPDGAEEIKGLVGNTGLCPSPFQGSSRNLLFSGVLHPRLPSAPAGPNEWVTLSGGGQGEDAMQDSHGQSQSS